MKKWWIALLAAIAIALGLGSCSRPQETRELVVMTHDSFDISTEVIAAFEQENNAKVTFLKAGDAGEMLNKAILSKASPLADVLYGVDNTFLSRALSEGLFEPYRSPLLSQVPPSFVLDQGYRLLPVDWGDVCLNYDKAWFEEKGIAPPSSLEELIQPEYKGLTVVENPATSSPGLAFLLTTIGHFGEDGYLDYWRALRDNEVAVENGWSEAYYNRFSAAGKGDRPIVVSYATSPAAEVYYGERETPPTGAVVAPGTCFRQVEFVGVLEGSKQRKLARAFIDWMLSQRFQEDIPLHMWVFPVNKNAQLPPVFKFAQQAQEPVEMSPDRIAAQRENWIAAWTQVVLH